MDIKQKSVVQESFKKIKPFSGKITRVFYDRLFELDPGLRKLFKKDLRDQRRKFIKSLTFVIENINDTDNIESKLKDLAIQHILYQVQEKDYKTFGNALMFTLSAALGDGFTPQVKEAWKNTYNYIAQIMIKAAYRD